MQPLPKPRILFVDQAGAPGGAELALIDIVKDHLSNSSVVLFSDGPVRDLLEAAGALVVVMQIPRAVSAFRRESGPVAALRALPYLPWLIWRLQRLMGEYDVVFANTQKAFVIAALAARLAGKPCIWELQDIVSKEHFSSFSRRLGIILANRFAARVIANSNTSAAEFIAAGGDPSRVTAIPLGIDPMVFMPGEGSRDAIRRELGIGDVRVVGCFSRLSSWKGQHVLIEALAQLPDVHGLIVGKELFGEEDYRISLLRRVRELGLEHRVHFAGFTSRMPEMLSAVDFVVHTPTAPEPFGRVMVEAMLAAKPVVATGIGAGREIIEDGVSGLLVPPGDPDELAVALRRLVADPAWASSLAAQGRIRAESRFSLQAMLDGLNRELAAFTPSRALAS